MQTTLLFLVSLSLLAPPNACCCWADAIAHPMGTESASFSQRPLPNPTRAIASEEADEDCSCCKRHKPELVNDILGTVEPSAPQSPAKQDHAPTCPVVRKLDRLRVASLTSFINVWGLQLEQPVDSEPIAAPQASEAIVIRHWPDGLARHLRFGVLLI